MTDQEKIATLEGKMALVEKALKDAGETAVVSANEINVLSGEVKELAENETVAAKAILSHGKRLSTLESDIAAITGPSSVSLAWNAILAKLAAVKGYLITGVLCVVLTGGAALVMSGGFKGCEPNPVPPTPEPLPPPKPEPKPPAPIPVEGLRVLIVEESAERSKLPRAQQVIIFGERARNYLNEKCKEFRIWDKDVDTRNVPAYWQQAMAKPRTSLPWLIISNGKTGFEGPLPPDVDSFIAKVREFE